MFSAYLSISELTHLYITFKFDHEAIVGNFANRNQINTPRSIIHRKCRLIRSSTSQNASAHRNNPSRCHLKSKISTHALQSCPCPAIFNSLLEATSFATHHPHIRKRTFCCFPIKLHELGGLRRRWIGLWVDNNKKSKHYAAIAKVLCQTQPE